VQITITARHCEIPDELRARASEVMEKLGKMAHRAQRAAVVFDQDHSRRVVELRMYLPRGQVQIATAEAGDFRSALDRAVGKLRPQLERAGSRNLKGERTT
jgi:ribosomal subunit interface protein